jgi:hypothetical protein
MYVSFASVFVFLTLYLSYCKLNQQSATELSTAVAVLSDKLQSETPPTEQEVVAFLEMFDTDQDGSLDRDEFLRFAQQLFLYVMSYQFVQKAPEVSEVIQVIFNSCDTEGQGPDGLLVFSEVWDAVDLVNQQLPKALRVRSDADTVQAYIDAFSTGDKEGLNLQEFNEMITTILGLTE